MVMASKRFAALAMGISLFAQAAPSFAQTPEDHVNGARAAALRECNRMAKSLYPQYDNDHNFIESYRACMAAHGQME